MPKAPIALLIDADRGYGNVLREILEMKGFHVFRAYDSLGAVALLESLHPDLILLDVTMSEINGLAFIQGIKMDPSYANTKVIVMSSRIMDAEKAAAIEAGADALLEKPMVVDDLLEAVKEFLPDKEGIVFR